MTLAGAEAPAPGRVRRPRWVRQALGGATGRGVAVAVLDSGLDPEWADPWIGPGIGLVARGSAAPRLALSTDTADLHGHGTACADIVRQLAPEARIHPVRVFDRRLATSVEVLVAALAWAVEEGMAVVNLSLGTAAAPALRPLYRACEEARRAGVVVVAAVHGITGFSFPAVFDGVIGVGGAPFSDPYRYHYRSRGPFECYARRRCRVRRPGGGTAIVNGTSFAAPHIAGFAALFLERVPGAGVAGVRELLARHAAEGPSGTAGRRASPTSPADLEAEP